MKAPLLICILFLAASCKDLFQYNPNEVRLEEGYRNLNAKNIARINALPAKDSLKFILIGDSQRFYDQVEDFVTTANKLSDIDFVLLAGDISDFGTTKEFKWVHDRLSKLNVPYVAVIGNHDMLANGRLIYQQMYGPENFTFEIAGNKFICLNTCSEEVGFNGSIPDMPWLTRQVEDNSKYKSVFVVSHMPPFDGGFDRKLEQAYASLMKSDDKIRLSMHGHQHRYQLTEHYGDGFPYLVVGSMNKRNYAIVTSNGEALNIEEKYY